MDIVGSIGYHGQEIKFIDTDRYGFISGQCICIYDVVKGPREMLWRTENGIKLFMVNYESSLMALAPKLTMQDIEIVQLPDFSSFMSIRNPTSTLIIHLTFNRLGDRLYAISDTDDHNLIIWTLANDVPHLLVSIKLSSNCYSCIVNPCDQNQIVLVGDDGLFIGSIVDVLGSFTVKIIPCFIDQINSLPEDDCSEENMLYVAQHRINFVIWLPLNRLLICNSIGHFYELNCDSKANRFLGRFSIDDESSRPVNEATKFLIPIQAILSVNSFIFSTSVGNIYWFPINDLMSTAKENTVLDFTKVQQISIISCNISSLSIDQNFQLLLVGCSNGDIMKLSLEVVDNTLGFENELNKGVEGEGDNGFGAGNTTTIPQVKADIIASEYQAGIALSAKHLSIGVDRLAGVKAPRCTVTMFVIASDSGQVTFWRHNSFMVDPLNALGGIRCSMPRPTKLLYSIETVSLSTQTPESDAICVMEFTSVPNRPSASLIIFGNQFGFIEVWILEATEFEEEEMKESNNDERNGVKYTEDDEGSCFVKLESKKLYSTRVFDTSLSFMTPFATLNNDGSINTQIMMLGSWGDNRVFFLNLTKGDQIAIQSNPAVVAIADDYPRSCVARNFVLFIFCKSGAIHTVETNALENYSGTSFTSGISPVLSASLSPGSSNVILLSNSSLIYLMPLRSLNLDRSGSGPKGSFKSLEHKDIVICIAHSPSGRYFATGCIDGSVVIWKVDTSDDVEIMLINFLRLHSAPVLTMTFSADSSLLMTRCIDGSTFLVTIDKPSLLNNQTRMTSKTGFLQESALHLRLQELPTKNNLHVDNTTKKVLTLAEQRDADLRKVEKAKFKFRSMGIGAAISEIAQRLHILLKQNAERSELESVPRSEFVIDLKHERQIVAANTKRAENLRRDYHRQNMLNELRAARIRVRCWDSMEVNSVTLMPFFDLTASRGFEIQTSSFPIKKYTADELALLQKVKRLRGVELRTQKFARLSASITRLPGPPNMPTKLPPTYRCTWFTAVKGCPPTTSWILNDGTRWPCSDAIEALLQNDKIDQGTPDQEKNAKEVSSKGGATSAATSFDDLDDDNSVNDGDNSEREIDENNILNLLYPPQAVRTQIQKRMQIIFLKEVIRMVKSKYNEKFQSLMREKEDIIASVASRNNRIKEILHDLHAVEEDIFEPKFNNIEISNSTIKIFADEMKNKPYESEIMRQIRLKEEEEKRRRDAEKDKEDVKGRALDEMMYGTLEVKRDVLAESISLQKPEWMDHIAVTDMTESQAKEYEAYQLKIKTIQEEQNAYRKSLEQEMKKIKNEIMDMCKLFDDKLEDISKLKVLVQREMLSQEVYISRISLNMSKQDQIWKLLKKTEDEIQLARKDRNEVKARLDKANESHEEMKTRLNNILEEEKQMDKTFRRDLQNLCDDTFDQESLKYFTQLYRIRTYPHKGPGLQEDSLDQFGDQSESNLVSNSASNAAHRRSKDSSAKDRTSRHGKTAKRGGGHNSSMKNDVTQKKTGKLKGSSSRGGVSASAGGRDGALGPMQQAAQALRSEETKSYKDKDPYFLALIQKERQKRAIEAQIPLLDSLNIETDCPEGFEVDQFSWSKLVELRSARIEKEIEGKLLTIEVAEFKSKIDVIENEEALLMVNINESKATREGLIQSLHELDSNLDIMVALRQGQDEVDHEAAVTDYSDAVFLPIEILTKYNSRIKELGKEKITFLSKIKQFRRKINLIHWEAIHFGLESHHYEAYFTDLQLFRVTRELQKIIREGSDLEQAKERLDKVAIRKDFLLKDADLKLNQMKKEFEFLQRQYDDRLQECSVLENRITSLQSQVNRSERILHSRDEARGAHGDPVSMATMKMKKVVTRRHMVDTARSQAEEIDFLRQELDKMRQRTFPSFIRATRKRISANDDEF